GGIGKTWSSRLFSNFALAFGTECDYLPEYRFDADINLKLLRNRNLIATLGYTYSNAYTPHEDIIWHYGASLYIKRFIFELMFFDNLSKPGDVKSGSMQFSIGYGEEFRQWTYLIFNFGSQAYQDTFDPNLNKIEMDSNEITLRHRRWLKQDFGWFAAFSYMELANAYNKYLFQLGLFRQY
nr:YaiO family outer membrane beta-barrel protein [Candidatus Cloacimonadota bacterium]